MVRSTKVAAGVLFCGGLRKQAVLCAFILFLAVVVMYELKLPSVILSQQQDYRAQTQDVTAASLNDNKKEEIVKGCFSRVHQKESPNVSAVINIMTRHLTRAEPGTFCDNFLDNVTDGTWIRKTENLGCNESDVLITQEKAFEFHLQEFRIKRGMHAKPWRDDGKCGYKNFQKKDPINNWGGKVGSWCNATSDKPCCSDVNDGRCGTECECTKCIDMRKIYHAEFCEWTPVDRRCKLQYYDKDNACSVMRRLSEIHFIGDSFVRKFARTLILHLRSDLMYGGQYKSYDAAKKKKCVGIDQLYWTECRYSPSGEFKNILLDKSDLCGMDLSRFFLYGGFKVASAKQFHSLIKSLAGKVGSLVLAGVGSHDNCNTSMIAKSYLGPAIEFLREYRQQHPEQKRAWPHIVFSLPDKSGLMKALQYQRRNGNELCDKFSKEITLFCQSHNIPVINFRKVTEGVHSYDGAHHGIGVNLGKVQIFLNYLDLFFSSEV